MAYPHEDAAGPDHDAPDAVRYRIDDLARATGVTVRNIRQYQTKGILAGPAMVGRTGWYSEEHVSRLRLIRQLIDRGHSVTGVAQLLETWEEGGDLQDLLGAKKRLTRPWATQDEEHVTAADLRKMLGPWMTPSNVRRAQELGLVEIRGSDFAVASSLLLDAMRRLLAIGMTMTEVLDIAEAIQRETASIAAIFIDPFKEQIAPGGVVAPPETLQTLISAIDGLRPLTFSVPEFFLARAMQSGLAEAFAPRPSRLPDHDRGDSEETTAAAGQAAVSADAWSAISSLLPDSSPRRGGRWRDHRQVLEAIAWRERTGRPWRELPAEFGPWQTAWKRHKRWVDDGTWQRLLAAVHADPRLREELSWLRAPSIDGAPSVTPR